MAGWLENALMNDSVLAALRPPGVTGSAFPEDYAKDRPTEIDYSQGVPMPFMGKKKTATEKEDEELAAFQQRNPVPVPPMAAQPAVPGLLGANIQPQTMPPGVGGAPGAAPAPPVPALPPPVNVAPPPGGVPAPAPASPAAVPSAAPQPAPGEPPATDLSSRNRGSIPPETPGLLARFDQMTQRNPALLLSLASGFAGAPSFGTGMSRAFGNAVSGLAQDQKLGLEQGKVGATYRALVKAGLDPQTALAAASNPAVLQQVAPDYLGSRKSEIKVLKDSLGNERLVSVNPYTGEQKDIRDQSGASTSGGGVDNSALAKMPVELDPKTGRDEKFLEAFRKADPVNAAAAENILAGNSAGTGRNLQQLQKYAERIDPTFNQATFAGRQNLYKSYYGGGEGFKQLRSANTAINHGMQLKEAIERLHNYTVLPDFLNRATGAIASQYSEPYQKALKDFNSAKAVYAHELETALTGKSTVSGYKEINDLFDAYGSPASNMSSLQSTLGKLQSRVEEHESSYSRGMGGRASTEPVKDFLTNKSKLDALLKGDEPTAKGVPAAGVAGPKNVPFKVITP